MPGPDDSAALTWRVAAVQGWKSLAHMLGRWVDALRLIQRLDEGGDHVKIQDKHTFHGAALTQIVEHPAFTALNKADAKYGHYVINHDIRLLMKYCSSAQAPWNYTVNLDDLRALREDFDQPVRTFLCLVCGLNTVCLLNGDEIGELIDVNSKKSLAIRVTCPPGGSLRVSCGDVQLRRAITHSAFPEALFA